jgi:CRP/FNR family transcriptional regulator, anaerobic regulatory protein
MSHWSATLGTAATQQALSRLTERNLPAGTVLFRPGEAAQAFPVVLAGRVEVHLVGPSGRGILLYAVAPGETCIQTTLGLLGDEAYGGEAVAATGVRAVMVPRALFLRLIDEDPQFRLYVLRAFGQRMGEVTRLLQEVAFGRIETRLAQALIALAEGDVVRATQGELAARIGTAREVVTRRLDALARAGVVATERGTVRIIDANALRQRAAGEV